MIVWLLVYYFFMVDIENYYIANPTTTGATLSSFKISDYSVGYRAKLKEYIVTLNTWLAEMYTVTYEIVDNYINPFNWFKEDSVYALALKNAMTEIESWGLLSWMSWFIPAD